MAENSDSLDDSESRSSPRSQTNNSYGSAPSFAALRDLPIQPIVGDSDWHSDVPRDFQQRFTTGQYYLSGEPNAVPERPGTSSSSGSMAVAFNQSQSTSAYTSSFSDSLVSNGSTVRGRGQSAPQPTPSLTDSFGTTSSRQSASTRSGNSALNRYQADQLLEENEEGVLQLPLGAASWRCPYGFLGCEQVLTNIHEWDSHCQSHFLRPENLPKTVVCPFDCDWSYSGPTGQEAWTQRWTHVWSSHSAGGFINHRARPSSWLVNHLWRIRAISTPQMRDLRLAGHNTADGYYLEANNSSGDRLREQRERTPRSPGPAGGYSSGYQVIQR